MVDSISNLNMNTVYAGVKKPAQVPDFATAKDKSIFLIYRFKR